MGRNVVVTGASSGIGRAVAVAFAAAGDSLFVTANRNLRGLGETAASCGGPGRCETFAADLSDPGGPRRLFDAAVAWRPRIDVWVNAAGADVLTGGGAELSFEAKLDLLWAVDVRGTILLSRLASRHMASQHSDAQEPGPARPCVLNVSWDQAERGIAGESGQYFGATKAAVAAFSRSLAMTAGPAVRVNCLAPGWIRTAWGEHGASKAWRDRAVGEAALGRWGTPEDVAAAALWLADPAADFVNGQVIPVNGGWKPAY